MYTILIQLLILTLVYNNIKQLKFDTRQHLSTHVNACQQKPVFNDISTGNSLIWRGNEGAETGGEYTV